MPTLLHQFPLSGLSRCCYPHSQLAQYLLNTASPSLADNPKPHNLNPKP
ncbi:MAG: hypothetical protein NZM04_04210 [Methylacidiphilales bacterium]|nr:hypothetical protein [Candidatus Methylacidiphilales bacterium]MDW8349183.1 hypothetical protein [Verrucomicrobiae bacterium]